MAVLPLTGLTAFTPDPMSLLFALTGQLDLTISKLFHCRNLVSALVVRVTCDMVETSIIYAAGHDQDLTRRFLLCEVMTSHLVTIEGVVEQMCLPRSSWVMKSGGSYTLLTGTTSSW